MTLKIDITEKLFYLEVIKLQKPYGCYHEMTVVISNGCKTARRLIDENEHRIWMGNIRETRLWNMSYKVTV